VFSFSFICTNPYFSSASKDFSLDYDIILSKILLNKTVVLVISFMDQNVKN